jgi:(2Fe-2S) ferredoxin
VSKKKKLKKRVGSRLTENESALVICIGKDCAPREESRALVEHARAYVEGLAAPNGSKPPVRVEVLGCLGICKKGPIAATLPRCKFYKRVNAARADELIDSLVKRSTPPLLVSPRA